LAENILVLAVSIMMNCKRMWNKVVLVCCKELSHHLLKRLEEKLGKLWGG
jgi:hypothetical protein